MTLLQCYLSVFFLRQMQVKVMCDKEIKDKTIVEVENVCSFNALI